MPEIDKIRILEIIRVIEKNKKLIVNANIDSVDILKENVEKYYFVSLALFNIFNYLIDLSEELIECLDLEFPTKYVDIPKILLQNKIISKDHAKRFKEFIEYRNSIAHEYDEIFENEIFWCINHLDFIDEFVGIVKNVLLK